MRTLLLLAVSVFVLISNVHGASFNMDINLTGGEVVTIPVDDIRIITFSDCSGAEDPEGPQHPWGLFELRQNHPNPFNPSTTIEYQIPRKANVSVSVFDITGRLVREILNETQGDGLHQVTWNGTDENDARVASGIYFCTVKSDGLTLTKKMILVD